MRIRKRNGEIVEVDDSYVLADGETYTVGLMMMDSTRRATVIHDGSGRPAGQRPGFLFRDDEVSFAVRETVHQEYRDAISQRWKSDRWQSAPVKAASPAPTFATADAASVAASYAAYDHDTCNRWKNRR